MDANWMIRKRAAPYALALVAIAAACGGGGGENLGDWVLDCPKVTGQVASVRVSPPSATIRVGDRLTIRAVATSVSGQDILWCEPARNWSSSDPSVASVSQGVVTAVSAGSAWIRVEIGGKSDSSAVKVTDAPIASLTINPAIASLLLGQTADLSVAAVDAAGNALVVGAVTWSSSDAAVATVSSSGMVTGRAAGAVTIKATVETTTAAAPMTIVDGPPSVRFFAVSAGYSHTCALVGGGGIPDGAAYCWGAGIDGQLGRGSQANARRPGPVSTALTFARIAAGMTHTCAIDSSGSIHCWGRNTAGELGDGTTSMRTLPTPVATSVRFNRVAISGASTCALDLEGKLYCWGLSGQVPRTAPAPLAESLRFADIAGGWSAMCGLTTGGSVYCWGRLAEKMEYASPTLVSGDMSFTKFDVGEGHICGLTSSAELYCWGQVHGFPIGTAQVLAAPTLVPGAPGSSDVAAGGSLTCGISGSGAYCFGSTYLATPVPGMMVPVPLKHAVTRVSAGPSHACAIDARGSGWCWGRNVEWQVGAGEGSFIMEPLQLRVP